MPPPDQKPTPRRDSLPPSSEPSDARRAQPLRPDTDAPGTAEPSSSEPASPRAEPRAEGAPKRPPSWLGGAPPVPSASPSDAQHADALPSIAPPPPSYAPTWSRPFEAKPADASEPTPPRSEPLQPRPHDLEELAAKPEAEQPEVPRARKRNAGPSEDTSEGTDDGGIGELRDLLLRPERETLERLGSRVAELRDTTDELRANDVSQVLPEAVRLRSGQDSQLAKALAPTVEDTLRLSVQRNPQPIVDAIFPVIGPAIRRAVNESLSSLSANLNRTLDHSLSPRSISWRIEAWRTGQRFSDIVISRTLLYRVEQVFLIDRITGLPLQHVVAPDVAAQDGAVVSSMLAAIQDFVQDSFGGPDELDRLTLGEMTVLVEQGPKSILAAVVRGAPPPALRDLLQDLLESVHMEFGRELTLFDGDPAPLEPVRPLLETALVVQVDDGGKKASPVTLWLFAILLAFGALWLFFTLRERAEWNSFVARLDAEPGLVVTEAERQGGIWSVRGLRDPLAIDPALRLADFDVDGENVEMRWEPYLALDSALVVRRAMQLLEPPEGVTFAIGDDGRLVAQGRLRDPAWREDARQQARFLPGIIGYDDTALRDERAERYAELVQRIEAAQVRFGEASDGALGADALASLEEYAAELASLSEELGRSLRLRVFGYASQEGSPLQNERVSQRRADRVRDALIRAGIPASRIDAIGTGGALTDAPETSEDDRARNRVAVVRVVE